MPNVKVEPVRAFGAKPELRAGLSPTFQSFPASEPFIDTPSAAVTNQPTLGTATTAPQPKSIDQWQRDAEAISKAIPPVTPVPIPEPAFTPTAPVTVTATGKNLDPIVVGSTTAPLIAIQPSRQISTITNTATIEVDGNAISSTQAGAALPETVEIPSLNGSFINGKPVFIATDDRSVSVQVIQGSAIIEDSKGRSAIDRQNLEVSPAESAPAAKVPAKVPATQPQIVAVAIAQTEQGNVLDIEQSAPLPVGTPETPAVKPLPQVSPEPTETKIFQSGQASWYGLEAGNKTANGERYYPKSLTAAHRTLPFNTKVRVTNLRNGQSVVVRINNRGPFIRKRVIDLSEGAASAIGIKSTGVGQVQLELVDSKEN
jgi:rare lipoprotein A